MIPSDLHSRLTSLQGRTSAHQKFGALVNASIGKQGPQPRSALLALLDVLLPYVSTAFVEVIKKIVDEVAEFHEKKIEESKPKKTKPVEEKKKDAPAKEVAE